jgi:hypothetical protein
MKKYLLLLFLALISLKGVSQEKVTIPIDSLPFDAIINSTFGGKRMKYYGNIKLNLNQAFFENWMEKALCPDFSTWITTLIIRTEKVWFGTATSLFLWEETRYKTKNSKKQTTDSY